MTLAMSNVQKNKRPYRDHPPETCLSNLESVTLGISIMSTGLIDRTQTHIKTHRTKTASLPFTLLVWMKMLVFWLKRAILSFDKNGPNKVNSKVY